MENNQLILFDCDGSLEVLDAPKTQLNETMNKMMKRRSEAIGETFVYIYWLSIN